MLEGYEIIGEYYVAGAERRVRKTLMIAALSASLSCRPEGVGWVVVALSDARPSSPCVGGPVVVGRLAMGHPVKPRRRARKVSWSD